MLICFRQLPETRLALSIHQICGTFSIRSDIAMTFNAGDEELSLKMVDYWTNFAKYEINGNTDGVWTAYTRNRPNLWCRC